MVRWGDRGGNYIYGFVDLTSSCAFCACARSFPIFNVQNRGLAVAQGLIISSRVSWPGSVTPSELRLRNEKETNVGSRRQSACFVLGGRETCVSGGGGFRTKHEKIYVRSRRTELIEDALVLAHTAHSSFPLSCLCFALKAPIYNINYVLSFLSTKHVV